MGIFNKNDEKEKSEKAKKSAVKSKKAKLRIVNLTLSESDLINKTLVKPWITEKTHELMGLGKYVFKTYPKANKKQIKKVVESLYNVKVNNVSIINIHLQKKQFGRVMGKKSGYKKAIVSLNKGDKIDVFEGV